MLVVFFDLKSAFDTVDHLVLFQVLAEKGIGGNMLTWIIRYLTDRKIQVIMEDKYSSTHTINTGLPQGSILSPLLFILLLSTMPNVTPVLSKELADDIAFSVTADTIELAYIEMQEAIDRFSAWCKTTKLIINVQKTKAMCFSTKTPRNWTLSLDGENIEQVQEYKYLGMTLGAPSLTWSKHIEKLINKTLKALNLLRALAGTKWGADRTCLLKIFEALIRSKIAYGCPAFISASDTTLRKLEIIQNTALRIALGLWRSTRISHLQVEANMIPIRYYIQQQSISLYYKIMASGPTDAVHKLIFANDLENKTWTHRAKKPFVLIVKELLPLWNLPVSPNLKPIKYPVLPPWMDQLPRIYLDLIIPTQKSMGPQQNRLATLATLHTRFQDFLHVYTDGSRSEDPHTGSAFYVPRFPTQSLWRLPDAASIVSAELSAIHIATSWLRTIRPARKAVILSDSKSGLYLLKHRIPKQYIHSTTAIHTNLKRLRTLGWDISLQWIPSHCSIFGNEIVDGLANVARTRANVTYPIELTDLKRATKAQSLHRWQQWDIDKQNTRYGTLKPSIGDWHWCRDADRQLDVAMTKLRVEKVGLNRYLHNIHLSPTNLCTHCNSGAVEDTEHFLLTCQNYSVPRQQLFSTLNNLGIHTITLNTLLGGSHHDIDTKKRITTALATYLRSTGRLNKL